jgi:hypothetical protein
MWATISRRPIAFNALSLTTQSLLAYAQNSKACSADICTRWHYFRRRRHLFSALSRAVVNQEGPLDNAPAPDAASEEFIEEGECHLLFVTGHEYFKLNGLFFCSLCSPVHWFLDTGHKYHETIDFHACIRSQGERGFLFVHCLFYRSAAKHRPVPLVKESRLVLDAFLVGVTT